MYEQATKAALEKWHNNEAFATCDMEYCFDDVYALAHAYAAEHPRDDDEPLTDEWFRSVGAVDIKWPTGLAIIITSTMYLYLSINGALLSGHLQKRYRTRGEVRRLCAALGNPLKDTE